VTDARTYEVLGGLQAGVPALAAIKSAYRKDRQEASPRTHRNDPKIRGALFEINLRQEIIGDEDKRKTI